MRSTSPPATGPGPVELEKPRGSVLEEILCIDGVTDLHVYRMLTGRTWEPVEPEPPPEPAQCDGQLLLFPVLPCGGDE